MASIDKASQIREIRNYEGWSKQIWYWRTHLDRFIEEYFDIRLKDVQQVDARVFCQADSIDFVKNRGFGKTWETAIFCIAMGVLYPGSLIAVISGTAEQATLVLKKIDDYFVRNPNVLRQIDCTRHNHPVQLNAHKGVCTLKNGSKIESFSIGTFRGNRAKIIVCDEAPEIKKEDLDAIAKPVRNTTRDYCVQAGIQDYPSKIVSITSACLKSNYFYHDFVDKLKKMAQGRKDYFASAMNYEAAARVGISPMSFFEKERQTMTEEKFRMEYNSEFIGAEQGAVFPYELTQKCRVLKQIEIAQPVKSSSEYIMGVDLATSSAKQADNAVIVLIKLVELENGGYQKKVVLIRSFHGKRLDGLATQVRKLIVKFPNVSKVVVDCRGLGDAFPQFMAVPWTDPETNKEYPPLVVDTERTVIDNAIPLLHPIIATNLVNQQMVSATTIAFEQESIELPINSRYIVNNKIADMDDEDSSGNKKLTTHERAIYIEADALQIEMGTIVPRHGANGSVLYDTAKYNQHKDRYSALAMALFYIYGMEEERKKRLMRGNAPICFGIVTSFK